MYICIITFFFFFNDTATTEIYTLSLHDALPISATRSCGTGPATLVTCSTPLCRSEEHTSELQSPYDIVCRLLLEKKKIENIETCLGKHINTEKRNHFRDPLI